MIGIEATELEEPWFYYGLPYGYSVYKVWSSGRVFWIRVGAKDELEAYQIAIKLFNSKYPGIWDELRKTSRRNEIYISTDLRSNA